MSRINKLRQLAATDTSGFRNVLALMFFLPLYEFFSSSADAIAAIFSVPIRMLESFSTGIASLTATLLGAPEIVLEAGATESARSLTTGIWAQFGPFSLTVAVGVMLSTGYLISWYLEQEQTGNLVPWSFSDVPLIGSDEDGGD